MMERVTDFIFLGPKITADGDCSHETKRCLLLGGKAMTNLDSIFKSRDITLPTKVRLVKAMVFSVVMYGCESSTNISFLVIGPTFLSFKDRTSYLFPVSFTYTIIPTYGMGILYISSKVSMLVLWKKSYDKPRQHIKK